MRWLRCYKEERAIFKPILYCVPITGPFCVCVSVCNSALLPVIIVKNGDVIILMCLNLKNGNKMVVSLNEISAAIQFFFKLQMRLTLPFLPKENLKWLASILAWKFVSRTRYVTRSILVWARLKTGTACLLKTMSGWNMKWNQNENEFGF